MVEQEERIIMLCNTAELNEVQREWLRVKQLRILKRCRDEEEDGQLALHEKQVKLMAEQEDRTVMLCNTAELNDVQREWFRVKQLRILKRLRDEEEDRQRQLALHEKQLKLMAELEERAVMLCNIAELNEVQRK
ncbi:hypothetical protein BS78_06G256600 [Paspalum vaginatum]|nr:hypothetical protein BS78_06G249200 [Paspalum vaginatum]KAJ1273123.1 hypothetical protein BS78_06G256600 [Paspalum vaginatum]